ncbi:hypothetical protein AWM70_10265 [Paenibacillus yonginensis]|uniref:Mutants block sporulation after engulfment (Stage III sporulation) n=1 Tax=Paenibacillus yonginensis TaxID=1462996 RepID=A0A1B1N0J3_9BACL|nr:SpoIIIAH-like family protein [Paenibacillus yonginensis]ANS74935.1 hypothetical protein AWM70_10265 [Paenibacillus yonginensis]
MKTKRQTIWLVSMLSLMVVLSAYYLFTEDSGPAATKSADGQQVAVSDAQGTGSGDSGGSIVTEVTDETSGDDGQTAAADDSATDSTAADDQTQTDSGTAAAAGDQTQSGEASNDKAAKDGSASADASSGDKQAAGSQTAKTDEEVLETAQAQGTIGSDQLDQYQYERNEANYKKADELLQTMNDLSKTPEENAKAANEYNALQDKESKINDIEEQVSQRYGKAVVAEENNSFKVVVMNDKLQAKDAATIIDLVISELGVSQDKVKVQYVSSAK